jgi:hypothetical protein
MRYVSALAWCLFLVLSVSTSGWAAATAQGVALNADANCVRADLDLTLTTVNANREYGLVTLSDGTVLEEFEYNTHLGNMNGTYVGYGMGFSSAQPPGTVVGAYAYIGETPPDASDTAEFFVLYNCSTREVLYRCFGPFGSCPQRANNFTEGTLGTELLTPGSGFGTKKGKVLLGASTLKVLEWSDTLIRSLVSKALPQNTYDLTIRPKDSGASPITIFNGFAMKASEIVSVDPTSGSAEGNVTIRGFFFGTKKGKVTLDGKKCKVLSWKMVAITGESTIQCVIPKGLSPGAKELKVTNALGSAATSFTVE